jgi:hypothetical protein
MPATGRPPVERAPPALDPRLDRDDARDAGGWSIVVLPRSSVSPVREVHLSVAQVRWARAAAVTSGLTLLALVVSWVLLAPQGIGVSGVVAENLALKQQLQALESRMTEVDRVMLRLRVYDAQLRGLTEANGDHGPTMPLRAFTNGDADDQPPDAWIASMGRRADGFLAVAERIEPSLGSVVERLEDTRALATALPSRWPAHGVLTSGFGWRRHPLQRKWKFHSGYDIDGDWGDVVRAPADGVVRVRDWERGYGLYLKIDHGFGVSTLYGHLWRSRVAPGDKVVRGQPIASMGSSGMSTGPHLHFEIRIDDNPVDPGDYLEPDAR